MPNTVPTLDEMIEDVNHEIAYRVHDYPRLVEIQRLTQRRADHQLACMKAVLGVLMAHKAMSGPKVR
jgi:hypothetical protein